MDFPAWKKNVCCLRKICVPAHVCSCALFFFFAEGGACCVNRNVSGSLGNYFMVVMLHSLVYIFV